MDKLSLRLRLFLVMALPIAGLLYFSAAEVLSRLKTEHEIGAMRQLTDLAVAASAIVHELQKERGISAGFIGSKGERFRNELTMKVPLPSLPRTRELRAGCRARLRRSAVAPAHAGAQAHS